MADNPLTRASIEVRTKEITREARRVARLGLKAARLRKQIQDTEDQLRQGRRFLRGLIQDTTSTVPTFEEVMKEDKE